MKLTNKDKLEIRRSLFHQIDNIICGAREQSGYESEIEHIPSDDIRDYCYKIIGLYPTHGK
jgi:hypothetical protein